jgi:hypothetical protein
MIPLFSINEVYHVCLKASVDTFEELAVHCKEFLDFKYKHDFVGDVLFDTFGFLVLEVVDLLRRVLRVMHNIVTSLRSINSMFMRIGFVILKNLTMQLVIRLSSIHL